VRTLLLSLPAFAILVGLPGPTPAQTGKVTVTKVEYHGWKNNLKLANGDAEVIVTLDVGPRIISYRLKDGKNVFKEYDAQLGKSGEKAWAIRGGHRLWVSPEDPAYTYEPDNAPVTYRELPSGAVRFVTPAGASGFTREFDVLLLPQGSAVQVTHRIGFTGKAKADEGPLVAPWALSVMAPGGVEIIPLPAKKPHPSSVPGSKPQAADFAPNLRLAFWPFFDFKDPRYTFGTKYLTLRQDAKRGPTKIGLAHREKWIGYLNAGTLFVKQIGYEEGKTYPDQGVNFETFTNEDMLEVESLGPLVRLTAGTRAEHVETWNLFDKVADFQDEAGIDKHILPRVSGP